MANKLVLPEGNDRHWTWSFPTTAMKESRGAQNSLQERYTFLSLLDRETTVRPTGPLHLLLRMPLLSRPSLPPKDENQVPGGKWPAK